MSINIKSLYMALIAVAVLIYGAPVSASGHDMNTVMVSEVAFHHSDCADDMMEVEQVEDCCSTEECESNCMSGLSFIHASILTVDAIFEISSYTEFISQNTSFTGDNTNPPPIS